MSDILTLASDPMVLALDWENGLLGVISRAMKLVAVLVVLAAIIGAVKNVSDGKAGKAAQVIIGAIILVTFLWKPDLIETIINAFTGLTGKGIEEIDSVVSNTPVGTGGAGTTKP